MGSWDRPAKIAVITGLAAFLSSRDLRVALIVALVAFATEYFLL